MSKNTQLTNVEDYDVDRMRFEVQNCFLPNSKTMTYKRVNITTVNPDGTVGDLILPSENCFSFGIKENTDLENKEKITGYSLPICLWNQENGVPSPTKEQRKFTNIFDRIVEKCKDFLVENPGKMGEDEIDRKFHLKQLAKCIWKPKEKDSHGKSTKIEIPNSAPVLNVKLFTKTIITKKIENGKEKDHKTYKIITDFYDKQGQKLNPHDLIGVSGKVEVAIKIESIYYGSDKFRLQVKAYEVDFEESNSSRKRLLPSKNRLVSKNFGDEVFHDDNNSDDEKDDLKHVQDDSDSGSIEVSDEEEEKPKPKPKPKKKTVKVTRKKKTVS